MARERASRGSSQRGRCLYSHAYSQRVDTSWDEAGRAGTKIAENLREHSKLLRFLEADSHLENR
jgi:hypothetical protein